MTVRGERPPRPGAVSGPDDLVRALISLRAWAGNPSYAALAVAVGDLRSVEGRAGQPGKVTVYDCFRLGRKRLDPELVSDLVVVLGVPADERAAWRAARRDAYGDVGMPATVGAADLGMPSSRLIGRETELRLLADRGPGTVSTILGLPGAGKTELAFHVAALWRSRLGPDCVALGIDLGGYDPDQDPVAPATVLARLLQGLEIPSSRVETLDILRRRDLFWRTIEGRPSIIVLDNAASATQVLPLLPVGSRSRVVVTSRRTLPELSDAEPPVVLAELGEAAAVALLTTRIGARRVAAEPEAARRIAQRCGRIALDLTIAGAAVAAAADWSLDDHATRLEALPRDAQARPALRVSYDQLPEPVRRTFRALALHPGPILRAADVAALAAIEDEQGADHLSVLGQEHFLTEIRPAQFRIHDVVRAFALHLGVTTDPRSQQIAAFHRLADVLVAEVLEHTNPGEPDLAWLDERVPELSSFASVAGGWSAYRQLAQLAASLTEYFGITGQPASAEEFLRLALVRPDPDLESRLRRLLGRTLELRGDLRGALEQFELAHSEDAPDAEQHWNGIANVLKRMGRYREAVTYYRKSAQLARVRGNELTRGRALSNLSDMMRLLGHFTISHALSELAEGISRGVDDEVTVAIIRGNRTLLAAESGDLQQAIALAYNEIEAFEAAGFDVLAIGVRAQLARMLIDVGDIEPAWTQLADAWTRAEKADLPEQLSELRLVRARLRAEHGELAAAEADLHGVIEESRELGLGLPEIEALNRLGDVALLRGAESEAILRHEQAEAMATRIGDFRERKRARAALAVLRERD